MIVSLVPIKLMRSKANERELCLDWELEIRIDVDPRRR